MVPLKVGICIGHIGVWDYHQHCCCVHYEQTTYRTATHRWFVLNLRVLPHVKCGTFHWMRFIHECGVKKVIARKYLFSAVTTGAKETEINQQLHSIRFVMFRLHLLLSHTHTVCVHACMCVCASMFIFSSLAAEHWYTFVSNIVWWESEHIIFQSQAKEPYNTHIYASTLICGAIRLSKLYKLNQIFCRIFFLFRIICCGLLACSLARTLAQLFAHLMVGSFNRSFAISFVRLFVVVVVVRFAHHTHCKGIENHRKTSTLWETGWWRLCALILLHAMYTYTHTV